MTTLLSRQARASRGTSRRGIEAILIAGFALSMQDALIKQLSSSIGLWQIWLLRSTVALALLLIAGSVGLATWTAPRSLGWVAIRCLLLTAMWITYAASLPHLSLSVAAAGYYTSPLLIAVLSGPVAGERLGAVRRTAVIAGFAGTLLVLKPGTNAFSWASLLPVAAAALYALAAVITRTNCRDESPLALAIALNATILLVATAATATLAIRGRAPLKSANFLLTRWQPAHPREYLTFAALGVIAAVAAFAVAVAYQSARAAVVATFDYAYLVFAAGWGLVFVNQHPDLVQIAGMVLIAIAGTTVALHQARRQG